MKWGNIRQDSVFRTAPSQSAGGLAGYGMQTTEGRLPAPCHHTAYNRSSQAPTDLALTMKTCSVLHRDGSHWVKSVKVYGPRYRGDTHVHGEMTTSAAPAEPPNT